MAKKKLIPVEELEVPSDDFGLAEVNQKIDEYFEEPVEFPIRNKVAVGFLLAGVAVFCILLISIVAGAFTQPQVPETNSQKATPPVESKNEPQLGAGQSLIASVTSIGSKSAAGVITYAGVATTTDPTVKTLQVGAEIDTLETDMCVVASSTTAIVRWQYEFSQDGVNFYGEDTASSSVGALTHGPATTTHSWLPGTTNQVCKKTTITGLSNNFLRITFTRGAAFQNYNLFVEQTVKDGDGN